MMKRALFATLLVATVATSSGCCIIDRMFHCHRGHPFGFGRAHSGPCYGAENDYYGGYGPHDPDSCVAGDGSDPNACMPGYGGDPNSCMTSDCDATDPSGLIDYSGGPIRSMIARHRAKRAMYASASVAGPPSAAVGYPYYTLRGPRDFLAKSPGGISN